MMGFLDLEGLSHYDQKMKQILSSKQDSTFSDGSPLISVKGVTSEEYSLLSEEEKMLPIIYLVKGTSASQSTGNLSYPSTSTNSHPSFDVSYEPNNDEGIMTLEESFDTPYYESINSPSSFFISYS